MEEEYQESEIMFSDTHLSNSYLQVSWSTNQLRKKPKQRRRNRGGKSPPLDIPATSRDNEMTGYGINYYDDDDDEDEDDENLRLPPHLIVARRINNNDNNVSRKMACSICIQDEKGRILKGRNLCQVRNSILRLTGFYET
ncbi:hypothetical protein SOVF_043580 [Spinacia oleracea]|nr:hypothetical protein SOVF_043580 [Spinacia oleracea]